MEEEVDFIYEMLHPHSPACVQVRLPKRSPKSAQSRTAVAALKEHLGHDRVTIINPNTLTQQKKTKRHSPGRYYAYIHPEGSSPPALWEMLLCGAHVMATERNSPETAKRLYRRVLDLRGTSEDDCDFLYSLYRHLQTVPSLHLDHDFHDVVTRCRSFDAIDQAFRQRRAQRQARLLAWSAPSPPTAPSGSVVSLLGLLQMLPPPFTPTELLSLGSLAALARTSREWYAYVMGSQLPLLLRRAMNDPALAPMKWSYYRSYEGPTEDVWATCSLTYSSPSGPSSPPSTSTISSGAPSLFPIIECPPLLRYMLAHAVTVETHRSPAAAVAPLLARWSGNCALVVDPGCPAHIIKRCLRLLSAAAVGAASYCKSEDGFPAKSEDHMICLYLPSGRVTASAGRGPASTSEVVCAVGWGVYTPVLLLDSFKTVTMGRRRVLVEKIFYSSLGRVANGSAGVRTCASSFRMHGESARSGEGKL